MQTIQQLLKDKPEALAHVESLIAKHDVWVVGGAARCLLYPFLPFPSDIDLLLNTEKTSSGIFEAAEQPSTTGSGGQGQKIDLGGVKLDVFDNGLTKWLHGSPLNGDGVAIRALDGFALMTRNFHCEPWVDVNPNFAGLTGSPKAEEYINRHKVSMQRDMNAIADAAAGDFADSVAASLNEPRDERVRA